MGRSGIAGRRKLALAEGSAAYTARRSEIIEVAASVFKEKGYEAATLQDIAERLKTDRASLYYYVASKEELLQEIVRAVLEENVAMAERVAARDLPALKKLTVLIQEMMSSFDRNYPHMFVFIEDLARVARIGGGWASGVLETRRRFEKIVHGVIDQARAEGALRDDIPDDLAMLALFGMINWTHRWYKPGGGFASGDVASTFTELMFNGLRAPVILDGGQAAPR
jgi:AcrR family transcriptional regulator